MPTQPHLRGMFLKMKRGRPCSLLSVTPWYSYITIRRKGQTSKARQRPQLMQTTFNILQKTLNFVFLRSIFVQLVAVSSINLVSWSRSCRTISSRTPNGPCIYHTIRIIPWKWESVWRWLKTHLRPIWTSVYLTKQGGLHVFWYDQPKHIRGDQAKGLLGFGIWYTVKIDCADSRLFSSTSFGLNQAKAGCTASLSYQWEKWEVFILCENLSFVAVAVWCALWNTIYHH